MTEHELRAVVIATVLEYGVIKGLWTHDQAVATAKNIAAESA